MSKSCLYFFFNESIASITCLWLSWGQKLIPLRPNSSPWFITSNGIGEPSTGAYNKKKLLKIILAYRMFFASTSEVFGVTARGFAYWTFCSCVPDVFYVNFSYDLKRNEGIYLKLNVLLMI